MSTLIKHKGYIIQSSPLPLQGGGYSMNGHIEIHKDSGVTVISCTPDGKKYQNEKEADEACIKVAKKYIDAQFP
ncbi:MAG: hypothetical protein JSS53_06350 [Proteobacteria bacterium]|nr:hypothetical protein [Pseudomonadota bacterium]